MADPLATASGLPGVDDGLLPSNAPKEEYQTYLEEFDKTNFSEYEYRDQIKKLKYKKYGRPSLEETNLGYNTPRLFGKGYRVEIYQSAFKTRHKVCNKKIGKEGYRILAITNTTNKFKN